MKLQEIFDQLDHTRLTLYKNLTCIDDELEETYKDFLKQLEKLKELINEK